METKKAIVLIALFFFLLGCRVWGQVINDSLDSIRKEKTREFLKTITSQLDSSKLDSLDHHSKDVNLGITGMIIDNTKTKAGRDFYKNFYNMWNTSGIDNQQMIRITEEPFRLRSTIIKITIKDRLIFQSILQPRRSIIESLSENAFQHCRSYVENYEFIMKQLQNQDTAGDGIY